jgi:hypothetical protein
VDWQGLNIADISRQSSALLPLCQLHVTYIPPADDFAGEDHCQDDAVGWRKQDGRRRGDFWRRQFGMDQEHWRCASGLLSMMDLRACR